MDSLKVPIRFIFSIQTNFSHFYIVVLGWTAIYYPVTVILYKS